MQSGFQLAFRPTKCNPRGMRLMGHSPEMSERGDTSGSWWRTPLLHRVARLREREDQVFLILALVIGALTGLAVVAFILLTERMGMRLYPVGGAAWATPAVSGRGLTRHWVLWSLCRS